MIYLDNAATSFPKPAETIRYLNDFVTHIGGNPGRSGHALSLEAARVIFEAREKLTAFIGMTDSERLIFTQNGTESLNMALLGLLGEGDHVVTTRMEHNSVMRPLEFLSKERGVSYTAVPCSPEGFLDIGDIRAALKRNTAAVVINHGSNVTGTVQPLEGIKDAVGKALLIVDACQTIGSLPIDMEVMKADILCFSGHKSLFSIQGVGALYVRSGIELTPLKFGGTGSKSESIQHPTFLPDRYECGTPNTPGIASLLGGLTFIEQEGLGTIMDRKRALRRMLVEGLRAIRGVEVYGHKGPKDASFLATAAFNIKGLLPSDVGYELNRRSMYVRIGLHCAPMAHQTVGTFPNGSLRASPGYFTQEDDIRAFIEAVSEIAEG
ncbi:MAG TPA: aminotransferase class V-fold PLP-dependent enzyme [Syntrophorhabdaceae bacterium]|nr:aminotransferase class V-fold PLP-dependent enzyme [Syntrophorhabdaceae bacterium]